MPRLAITLGDPAGIGTEVVLSALAAVPPIPLWLFGDRDYTLQTARRLGTRFDLEVVDSLDAARASAAPRLLVDTRSSDGDALSFGTIDARYGRTALRSIELALEALASGDCRGLVTAPIHKQAIAAAGSRFPGHTELLAEATGRHVYGRDYAMYFDSPTLRVVLATVHLRLADAIRRIDRTLVADLARLTDRELRALLAIAPRIAVAGVNPHAGEGGMFGDEEEEIAAGIEEARREGIDATGPHSPDIVFRAAADGKFDAVIAMYHDQGLIAVKTLEFTRSVNVTLGLPFLRASVDHGTAFDIAGRGIADARPMQYAIEWTDGKVK